MTLTREQITEASEAPKPTRTIRRGSQGLEVYDAVHEHLSEPGGDIWMAETLNVHAAFALAELHHLIVRGPK